MGATLPETELKAFVFPAEELLSQKENKAARSKAYLSWTERSADTRFNLGLPPRTDSVKWAPWTGRGQVKLRGLSPTERCKDVLDVCFAHACRKMPGASVETLKKGLWANPGQHVDRLPVQWKLFTPTSSTENYSFEKDAALAGGAHMRLIGWPKDACPLEVFSEHELRQLVADSFSVPIAAAISSCFWLNPFAPWWKEEKCN